MIHLPHRDEDGLSIRARGYLAITTLQHLLIGLFCVLNPSLFDGVSYRGIKSSLPLASHDAITAWGWVLLVTAALCAYAAWVGRETPARIALLASVVVTSCWAAGFLVTALSGAAVPTGPIVWLVLVGKDATMLRQPLRNPFEPVVKRILDDNDLHRGA